MALGFIVNQIGMNRTRGKGHGGQHRDAFQVTLAVMRHHDDLSVFTGSRSVPSYWCTCHSADFWKWHSCVILNVVSGWLGFSDNTFSVTRHAKIRWMYFMFPPKNTKKRLEKGRPI